MRPLVLLVSGKRRSGKSEFFKQIKNLVDDSVHVVEMAFAHQLKYMLAERKNMSKEDLNKLLYDDEFKEKHRQDLLDLGKEQRAIDKDIFVKGVLKNLYHSSFNERILYVITDCRLRNEFDLTVKHCMENGFDIITVRINATDEARKLHKWVPDPIKDSDISEVNLDDQQFNYTIENNGTMDQFVQKISPLLMAKYRKSV